ncbi:MAG TPA: heterodisulfide reductase-related iron-sulfur binding cluster [Stellaceae bacterium]|jgi:glycerol-3-phosphate dehydrogenase subunit C|nr:heterodisulfide reductase-related iron-sulfur binding cluster [Stellaceae bacterium]
MAEGGLGAPMRHPISWQDPDFYDAAKVEAELTRVFEICHGCRRCFNLCDSFPRLFDLIDSGPTGEVDGVDKKDYAKVVEACTLCDMCFMTKCPYVPPHPFDLDFPHLMLRARAAELKAGHGRALDKQLVETDRNGRLGDALAPLANWAVKTDNHLTRPLMEKTARIDRRAELPKFHGKSFMMRAKANPPARSAEAPARSRKAVLYATCFVNYNNPRIGEAVQAVLAKNGVETVVAYPGCCGMPQFERGDLARVAESARHVAAELKTYIDQGYDVVALVPSCALMLKFEWPLLLPEDADVKRLSEATYDASEYLVDIAKHEGLAPGLKPLPGGVTVHIACHARAQNMGQKAAEMLRLLPATEIAVIERCSGHGGSWGVMTDNFEVAIKIGKPVARSAAKNAKAFIASECPLAAMHIRQDMAMLGEEAKPALDKAGDTTYHPLELMALAYGVLPGVPTP